MHFVIVGSGAVGGYFGARLAQANQQVTFIARNQQLAALQKNGLVVNSIKGDMALKNIVACDNCADIENADVVILAVKSFQLADAMQLIKPMVMSSTRIIPLLNGVSAMQQLVRFGFNAAQVYGGVAKIISQVTAPGVICHSGSEPHITLGLNSAASMTHNERDSEMQHLQNIVQCFKDANVSIAITQNIELALWRKFIFVAAWGALAAKETLAIGALRADEHRANLIAIIKEYQQIANRLGVEIFDKHVEQTLTFIDALPAQSETSMQRDINKAQSSEFDVLVAYPYQLARQHQLVTPVLARCYHYLNDQINYNK